MEPQNKQFQIRQDVDFISKDQKEYIAKAQKQKQLKGFNQKIYLVSNQQNLLSSILFFTLAPKESYNYRKIKKYLKGMDSKLIKEMSESIYLNNDERVNDSLVQQYKTQKQNIEKNYEKINNKFAKHTKIDQLEEALKDSLSNPVHYKIVRRDQQKQEDIIQRKNVRNFINIYKFKGLYIVGIYYIEANLGLKDSRMSKQSKQEESHEEKQEKKQEGTKIQEEKQKQSLQEIKSSDSEEKQNKNQKNKDKNEEKRQPKIEQKQEKGPQIIEQKQRNPHQKEQQKQQKKQQEKQQQEKKQQNDEEQQDKQKEKEQQKDKKQQKKQEEEEEQDEPEKMKVQMNQKEQKENMRSSKIQQGQKFGQKFNINKFPQRQRLEESKKRLFNSKNVKEEYFKSYNQNFIYEVLILSLPSNKIYKKYVKRNFSSEQNVDMFRKKMMLNNSNDQTLGQKFQQKQDSFFMNQHGIHQLFEGKNEEDLQKILKNSISEQNILFESQDKKIRKIVYATQRKDNLVIHKINQDCYILGIYEGQIQNQIQQERQEQQQQEEQEEPVQEKEEQEEEQEEPVQEKEEQEQEPVQEKEEQEQEPVQEKEEQEQEPVQEKEKEDGGGFWFQILMLMVIILLVTANYTQFDLSFFRDYYQQPYIWNGLNEVQAFIKQ